MATTNRGFFIPAVLLTVFFAMLVTPTTAVRSKLLSRLYNKASDNTKPLILVLDDSVLTQELGSNRLDSDLLDLGQHNQKTAPYVYLLNQLAQPAKRDQSKFGKPVRSRQRDRRQRQRSRQNRQNRHSRQDRDRYSRDRNRNIQRGSNRDSSSDDDDDDDDEYRSRSGKYQRQKYRYRSNRHLRTDVKRDQEPDREEHNIQPSPNRVGESAQAQIPVVKSLLRSLNCHAKNECQDTCTRIDNNKKKDDCEYKCEEKFECEESEEEEEDNECDNNSCETTPACNKAGSTKGPPPDPTVKTCKRC